MTNSIRNDFHTDLAATVAKEIFYKRSNYYYFLGKIDPWGFPDNRPTSNQIDSDYENTLVRSNAIYMKKIVPNEISLVTTRYDWEAGSVFDMWDNTKNMKNSKFYCLTVDNNVYKCLDNNGGVVSTVKPESKSFTAFRSSDGYVWKYMYTIPSFKRSMFLSLNYLPVQKSLTDSFYNKGSVDAVVINSGGSGYLELQGTTIVVSGATTGSGATGSIAVDSVGKITGVTITNGGTAYTAGVNVKFISSTGSSAKGTATIVGGVVTGVTILTSGFGYASGDVVSFTVGGANIIPSVSKVTGTIEKLNIISAGAGYTSPPTLTVVCDTGTGKYGNATALVHAIIYNGSIVNTYMVDPGKDYRSVAETIISVIGDGTGADFTPVLENGKIVDIVIESYGSGYTYLNLVVTGSGTGADLSAIIAASDFISEQSIIEQTAIPGAIYSIPVIDGGENYTTNTQISIVGDGTGCTATPVIENGSLKNIFVETFGSGYTYAYINIVDNSRNTNNNPNNASAYAIFPPINGHGYDAVSELYGSTLSINSSLRRDIELNTITQDYRQFGIIKNPKDIITGKSLTVSSSMLTFSVVFSNTTNLTVDEVLVKNGTKYRVVYISGNVVYLQQLGIKYTEPIGSMYAEKENTRTYNAISISKYPTANKYSGDLLYVSAEQPFLFTAEQGIIIKTLLKF